MKKELYSLILGMLYVFVAYGTTKIFFSNEACISITMIVMTSLLFVPSISRFLTRNVKIETKNSAVRFFRTYKTLMCIFLFLFIGIFAGYLIIGSFAPESISYQDKIIQQQNALAVNKEISDTNKLFGIITNNIEVIIISFIVSLFYGAGAFFLLVRTASVFASFVLGFSSMIAKSTQTTALLLSVHFVPEIFGFILAAFAGGIVSKALVKEKIGTSPFRNTIKDSTWMLILSVVFIIIGALAEVYVTGSIANTLAAG